MTFKQLIKTKIFIAAAALTLVLLTGVEYRQYQTRKNIQREIDSLTKQADQIQSKNKELEGLIAYLKTDDYTQRAAREQLNLQKPDEFVYSFAAQDQNGNNDGQTVNAAGQINSIPTPDSNLKKWWNYFFSPGGNSDS